MIQFASYSYRNLIRDQDKGAHGDKEGATILKMGLKQNRNPAQAGEIVDELLEFSPHVTH